MKVHYFPSTGEAYDASQTNDDVSDGDVLVVESEGVVGIMAKAWPVAIDPSSHGAFHVLADGYDWATLCDGQYAHSFALASSITVAQS